MAVDTEDIEEREKIAKEIARTSESIRKKHRTLKTGRVEQEIELEKQFKPIVAPLKQIVENTGGDDSNKEPLGTPDFKKIRKRWSTPRYSTEPLDKRFKFSTPIPLEPTPLQPTSQELTFEPESADLTTSVRQALQEDPEELYGKMGPMGQKYVGALLSGDTKYIDNVYGVYFTDAGTFLGDKAFDIDGYDNLIIDGVKYKSTRGLFELIFKKVPKDYTEDDKQKYKNILLATNAHRHHHNAQSRMLGNRGYKYRYIIAPLFEKEGRGVKNIKRIPHSMTVTENKVDYVHWDDPNELVGRLRLLDSSRQAGNNAHDNEFLSIIEELREAGLIIN